ncbi:IATP ATPase inhibitor [Ceratobasidium theobromae]|uniref:ATPase inhibitor, mitochondrial n=1 Tax=Ceratobasidium theobromae TaxID=1582974 RepID=A0A5N5QAU6_9AGAM|nr:IATP ATPase inhibitor [Ceratobasidium theobromae]
MIARFAARAVSRPTRIVAARATTVRFYSEDQFGRKEKAHEDQYVRQHEKEQLKRLRAQLAKNEQENAELKKKIEEHENPKA